MMRVATHSGKFHADDVYAVAALKLYYTKRHTDISIVRSREESVIDDADIVVDVGKVYDPTRQRFDHHQNGLAPRENGVPYASFGLVWRAYGNDICGSDKVAERIDQVLVQPIDANDNGMRLTSALVDDIQEYSIPQLTKSFVPTWQEEDLDVDEMFQVMSDIALAHIQREMAHQEAVVNASDIVVSSYEAAHDKRVITLPHACPWKEALLQYEEPRFVIYPVKGDNDEVHWYVQAVPTEDGSFENRKDFPGEWAGKSREELQAATKVSDAIFAHKGRFLVVVGSNESALDVARKALEGSDDE